jgi:hypothetical protein
MARTQGCSKHYTQAVPEATRAAQARVLDLGGLVLSVSDARTAQIFHIVDQLSQWSIYTHKEYVRWAEKTQLLDQQDRELLQQHAEMCKKHGSGHGFEQTFLVDDSNGSPDRPGGLGSHCHCDGRRLQAVTPRSLTAQSLLWI